MFYFTCNHGLTVTTYRAEYGKVLQLDRILKAAGYTTCNHCKLYGNLIKAKSLLYIFGLYFTLYEINAKIITMLIMTASLHTRYRIHQIGKLTQ